MSFARKATYSELTASATPSIVSRLPPGSLHGVRRDSTIDAGPASKWLRDGLSSAADSNEALRVVETIFVSDGMVTDWLGCTPQGHSQTKAHAFNKGRLAGRLPGAGPEARP